MVVSREPEKTEKVHVLMLITVMDRAGAETMLMNYLRNIDRSRVQIDFLINRPERADYEDEIEQLGSRVYHMGRLYPGNFRKYRQELRAFLEEHPQYRILHSHLGERSYFALKVAKELGIPVRIVHAHSVPKHFDLKKPVRLWFRKKLKKTYTHRASCGEGPARWLYGKGELLSLNQYLKQEKAEKENCKATIIIKNAIDTKKFLYDEKIRRDVRRKFGIEENTVAVGHIGRFVYEKNQDFVADVFFYIQKHCPNSKLLFVGGGKPNEERINKEKIQKKVQALGMEEQVEFLGVRNDVAELMQAMDVLLMPSVSEGFPVTLIEAQSVGLPCLVSDVISEKCNINGDLQYMSLKKTPEEWAKRCLEIATARTVQTGKNELVEQAGFDIRENAKLLAQFYLNMGDEIK